VFRKLVPSASQRCHWRENEVGVGDQLPLLTVNCSPTTGVPVTVGFTVFAGPFFEARTALGSDDADAFPSAFVAVTTTRNVRETSPETGV
jgi:hypothetical protein